jgi:hypothetical protein
VESEKEDGCDSEGQERGADSTPKETAADDEKDDKEDTESE